MNSVSSSVGSVLTPAGLEASVGIYTANYIKDKRVHERVRQSVRQIVRKWPMTSARCRWCAAKVLRKQYLA